jgi:hypothetical protein
MLHDVCSSALNQANTWLPVLAVEVITGTHSLHIEQELAAAIATITAAPYQRCHLLRPEVACDILQQIEGLLLVLDVGNTVAETLRLECRMFQPWCPVGYCLPAVGHVVGSSATLLQGCAGSTMLHMQPSLLKATNV